MNTRFQYTNRIVNTNVIPVQCVHHHHHHQNKHDGIKATNYKHSIVHCSTEYFHKSYTVTSI